MESIPGLLKSLKIPSLKIEVNIFGLERGDEKQMRKENMKNSMKDRCSKRGKMMKTVKKALVKRGVDRKRLHCSVDWKENLVWFG